MYIRRIEHKFCESTKNMHCLLAPILLQTLQKSITFFNDCTLVVQYDNRFLKNELKSSLVIFEGINNTFLIITFSMNFKERKYYYSNKIVKIIRYKYLSLHSQAKIAKKIPKWNGLLCSVCCISNDYIISWPIKPRGLMKY
jgi:hypothetical protein